MNVLVLDAASPQPAVALIARGRVYEQRLPGDRLIDLKDERAGSAAAALAAAVSRRPKQPDAAGASAAIYSRPSAAEEKRGAP